MNEEKAIIYIDIEQKRRSFQPCGTPDKNILNTISIYCLSVSFSHENT